MAEGELCTTCFVGRLQTDAGMLICDACGTTVQEFAEETQEFQTGISDARRFRRIRASSQQITPLVVEERKAAPKVKEGLQVYVNAVQNLLMRQTDFLCMSVGVARTVKNATRAIWFAYLPKTGVLEPSFASQIEAKAQARKAAAGKFENLNFVREVVADDMNTKLPCSVTLPILVLACWYTRAAIGPLDLANLALQGNLPYMDFGEQNKAIFEPYGDVFHEQFLTPSGVPPPFIIYNRASDIAATIALRCPPINAGLWLQKFISLLELPDNLYPVALMLYELHLGAEDERSLLSCSVFGLNPWAHVMTYLIVTLRLTCRIDDEAPVLSGFNSPSWLSWSERHTRRIFTSFPLTLRDALRSDAAGLALYTRYLRDVFFRGMPLLTERLGEYEVMLQGLMQQHLSIRGEEMIATVEDRQAQDTHSAGVSSTAYHYLPNGAGKRGIKSITTIGPEMTAVLTTCALQVWLTPKALLAAVNVLEQKLLMAECDVAYRHDIFEQQRISQIDAVVK